MDKRLSSPSITIQSSAPSLFKIYGWLGIVWMALTLVCYLIWLLMRPELRWTIALQFTGCLLMPPLLATFAAQLTSRKVWKLPVLVISLTCGTIALWLSLLPDLTYFGWFLLWLAWASSGTLLMDLALFRFGWRIPLIAVAGFFFGLLILIQYVLSVWRLASAPGLLLGLHGILLGGAWLARSDWRAWFRSKRARRIHLSRVDCFLLSMILTSMVFFLFAAQVPESVSDVRVYLPKLRDYVLQGGYRYEPWNPFTYYPNGWYNLFFIPYALGAEPAAKAFHVMISGVILLGIYALAWRTARNRTLALFATFLAYTIPMFDWLWYTLYQDATTLVFLLACTTMAADYAIAPCTSRQRNALLLGMLAGTALLIKLTPLVGLAAIFGTLGIMLLQPSKRGLGVLQRLWKPTLALAFAGIIMLLVCAPSWIPIWHLTGDPLFPAMTPLSDIGRSRVGLPNISWCLNPMTWMLFPYFATFHSWMAIDYHIDGALSPWLLMLWPFFPLNLLHRTKQRRFFMIFALMYWGLIFIGHEFSARYHILFYILSLLLGIAGVRVWLRHHRLMYVRVWVFLLCLISVLQLFLCIGIGLAVSYNFGQLRAFLGIQDRFLYCAKQWPGFANLWDRLELLPKDASVAVTSNYGMMACQLPRHAFTFETMWLSRKLPRLGWDDPAKVLESSGIAMELLPLSLNPERPSFYDWPENVVWRHPSRLVYAGSTLMFAAQEAYAEPAQEISLHQLVGLNEWGPLDLRWGNEDRYHTLELRLKEPRAGFTASWFAATSETLELFETGLRRRVPIQPALDRTPDITRRFFRGRFSTAPAALLLRSTQNLTETTFTLALMQQFKFPALRHRTSRATIMLPQHYHTQFSKTYEFENNVWFRSGGSSQGDSDYKSGPISACKKNWLAYRMHGAPGQTMQVYADLEATTSTTVHWDLRIEKGRLINQRIEKVVRRDSQLKPGRQQVLVEFPVFGENTPLTLLLWPECADGELSYYSGLVNFLQ